MKLYQNHKKGTITENVYPRPTTINRPPRIANQFNIFFANIGPIQSSSINYTGDKTFDAYLKEPNRISFEYEYVNESTIMTIITNLPNKNSCGFDGLSTTILTYIKGIIIKPLTLIINQILDTEVFSTNLKIAKIIQFF